MLQLQGPQSIFFCAILVQNKDTKGRTAETRSESLLLQADNCTANHPSHCHFLLLLRNSEVSAFK